MVAIRSCKYALISVAALLAGCAGLTNGAPQIARLKNGVIENPTNQALTAIRTAIQTDCLNVTAPPGEVADIKARRNRLVTAYMLGIDLAYNEYERNLLDSVRQNNLGASSASLALSTIGSVVGDQAIAQALSTTNAIVTGTHTAIGRDYLFNQTLNTLQTQMRASRAAQRAIILERLGADYDNWNSCRALSDVLAYEQAGTLNAALSEVAASAARANRVNEDRAQSVVPTIAYNRGPLAVALRAYLGPADTDLRNSRFEAAVAALNAMVGAGLIPPSPLPANVRLGQLVVGFESDDVRRALIAQLAAVEPNTAAKAELQQAIK